MAAGEGGYQGGDSSSLTARAGRETEGRVMHFRSPGPVYHSVLTVGDTAIVEVPSRAHNEILVMGNQVRGSGCLAAPIIIFRNTIDNIIKNRRKK